VNHLQDFISQAVNEYPVDPNRVYLLGFSQGAILSMTLALTMGNRIKGIVAMNGYIPGFVKEEYALQPMNRVSVFLTQGEFDHIFPPHVGQENYEYLRQHARAVKYTIYPEGHTISAEMQEDFLRWLERDAFGDNR
jgi:phospholipase/carboxylesterase